MIRDVIKFTLLVLLVVIPIRFFIAQPFIVNGASMSPTFSSGEYLIVDQISYRFQNPQRGDVVVFKYPNNPDQYFIKRVVGLPQETIKILNSSVIITNEAHPDGMTLDEPYINVDRGNNTEITLEEDEYYVLGDNRVASSDSRSWGPLEEEFIVGRPFMRLLPPQKITLFPGEYENYEED